MSQKTEKNLAYAFSAESKAAARNYVFAKKAEAEGYTQAARLFRAVSDAESVHSRKFLMLMRGKIGSTEENLATCGYALRNWVNFLVLRQLVFQVFEE